MVLLTNPRPVNRKPRQIHRQSPKSQCGGALERARQLSFAGASSSVIGNPDNAGKGIGIQPVSLESFPGNDGEDLEMAALIKAIKEKYLRLLTELKTLSATAGDSAEALCECADGKQKAKEILIEGIQNFHNLLDFGTPLPGGNPQAPSARDHEGTPSIAQRDLHSDCLSNAERATTVTSGKATTECDDGQSSSSKPLKQRIQPPKPAYSFDKALTIYRRYGHLAPELKPIPKH